MGLLDRLRGKKEKPVPAQSAVPMEKWMTSQLPALYLQGNDTVYRSGYLRRLESIGFKKKDAQKMFDFECEVIRRHGKAYLLDPRFTESRCFGLRQPFFCRYPAAKEDILRGR